ncbi:MAG: FAD-dependent oxidoreductase [Chthoniobacteraceae bacterium]
MDLRSGETVWILKHGCPPVYPPLSEDLECDVAIVGGGITGALIAHELGAAGFQCVIIDKREPGGGSTSASTSLLSFELDTPLWQLATLIGEEDAVASYRACIESVHKIQKVVNQLSIPCDFIRRKSYYFAETDKDVPALEKEVAMRRKHDVPVEFLHQREIEDLFSFSRPAALLSQPAAEIDVVEFVSALFKAAKNTGLRAYGHTIMTSHQSAKDRVTLTTDKGHTITARKLVFATGYESEKYLGYKIGSLKSTYAIATAPVPNFPGWHDRSLIWNSARPYLYLRTTADNRAIIGGEDIDFQDEKHRDILLPEKTAKLENALRAFFPAMEFELACAWAGTFGETEDSLAYIGHKPEQPDIYYALGYGGNGITYSMIAAEIIRDSCLGGEHPSARLFRLER